MKTLITSFLILTACTSVFAMEDGCRTKQSNLDLTEIQEWRENRVFLHFENLKVLHGAAGKPISEIIDPVLK